MADLQTFRRRKDEFFRYDRHSPLTPEQRERFNGLRYYAENEALRFVLPIEKFEQQETITMQTSTGDVADFIRWGRIHFEVDGQPAALTVYASPGGDFFLPFTDATSGSETYGAGRYLEIDPLPDGQFEVDFNMAYNPYCAYSPYWSCPIPPQENRLSVPIRAGEMLPGEEWAQH
jgi:hypothetical protein